MSYPTILIIILNTQIFPLDKPFNISGKEHRYSVNCIDSPYDDRDPAMVEQMCANKDGLSPAPENWV